MVSFTASALAESNHLKPNDDPSFCVTNKGRSPQNGDTIHLKPCEDRGDYKWTFLASRDVPECKCADGRDGETGADGKDGADGEPGTNGQDGNGFQDPDEDVHGDGVVDIDDCKGADGVDGAPGTNGQDGIDCWGLNGNGLQEIHEDVNGDGIVDIGDCKGAHGQDGADGQDGDPAAYGT